MSATNRPIVPVTDRTTRDTTPPTAAKAPDAMPHTTAATLNAVAANDAIPPIARSATPIAVMAATLATATMISVLWLSIHFVIRPRTVVTIDSSDCSAGANGAGFRQ